MSLQPLDHRLEDPSAARIAAARKRSRKASRRTGRNRRSRRDPTLPAVLLLLSAAAIGAAIFAVSQTTLAHLFLP